MEWKAVRIVGVVAGVTAIGVPTTQATVLASTTSPSSLAVTSYSALLQPVPNAVEVLKASNAELLAQSRSNKLNVEHIDWPGDQGHHHHHHEYYAPPSHHHHHHEYYAPPPPPPVYHHHHHHHHSGAVIVVPSFGIQIN